MPPMLPIIDCRQPIRLLRGSLTNPHENGAGHHKRSFGASQETYEIVWSSVIQKRELAGKMAAEYVGV
jgi:hypothetical protein